MSTGLHTYDFVLFRLIVQELLNIEQFCHWKFNKIKTKILKDKFRKHIWETHMVIVETI
jgi:hypothetical protein